MHGNRAVGDNEPHRCIGCVISDVEPSADVLREYATGPDAEGVAGIVRDIEVRMSGERHRAIGGAVRA